MLKFVAVTGALVICSIASAQDSGSSSTKTADALVKKMQSTKNMSERKKLLADPSIVLTMRGTQDQPVDPGGPISCGKCIYGGTYEVWVKPSK